MSNVSTAATAAGAVAGSSFPTLSVLGLIFITLKLTGFIAWSWWWVTVPFWGPLALVIGLGIAGLAIYVLALGLIAIVKAILIKFGRK